MDRSARQRDQERVDVVFAVMPFADTLRPAIGVSLLQAAAKREGYSVVTEYCSFDFADRIGGPLYRRISFGLPTTLMVGEWIFAGAAFQDGLPAEHEYVERLLSAQLSAKMVERVMGARAQAEQHVDACVARIMHRRPRVVGFTSTFHQTCASLAVARRLKALPDPPIVIFGGANCEGEMGLQMIRSFPWIDAICHGEADRSFLRLLEALFHGASAPIGGVTFRDDTAEIRPSIGVQDLNALPIPDYDDFFEQLEGARERAPAHEHLTFETSRGCWWGAKHHCTFCGLNAETMTYRSKSPERALHEIIHLVERYGVRRVANVDNILDMRYLDTLLPRLAESDLELELFYEVKANMRYEQLRQMRAAGITTIQPGIESFSTAVLRLMNKGVTGLQNVQLLRWCEELGIVSGWNILAGFPGEPQEEYARMAELIPLLVHLHPPGACGRLRLDRFSPFHANGPGEQGLRNVRPIAAYSYIFPLAPDELERVAYYFDFDYDDGRVPEDYVAPVNREVAAWVRARAGDEPPRLDADVTADGIVLTDSRPAATRPRHVLTGIPARVYTLCDSVTSLKSLLRDPELEDHEDQVRATLDDLIANRLLIGDDGRYLSLAVFRRRDAAVASSDGVLTGWRALGLPDGD